VIVGRRHHRSRWRPIHRRERRRGGREVEEDRGGIRARFRWWQRLRTRFDGILAELVEAEELCAREDRRRKPSRRLKPTLARQKELSFSYSTILCGYQNTPIGPCLLDRNLRGSGANG
jgi:hypothetical protein